MVPSPIIFSSTLILLAFSHFASAQKLDKPVVNPVASLDAGLLKHLVPQKSRIKDWPATWIPKDCKTAIQQEKLDAKDVEVFEVFYDDVSI